MCSWTNNLYTGKFRTYRGEPSKVAIEEDDEAEDQIVYRHDPPNELLGLYRRRHEPAAQGPSQGTITKEKNRPQETSAKVLEPPSAVEEAAWASLTQADNHWRSSSQRPQEQEQNEVSRRHVDFAEVLQATSPIRDGHASGGIQGESLGNGGRKISWVEALQQLITQEVQSGENRAPVRVEAAQPGERHAEVELAETTVESVRHGACVAGQSSKSQSDQKSDTFGRSKGKQKHHSAERFRINNFKAPVVHLQEGAPVPLAQRLQELADGDSEKNAGPCQARGRTSSSSSLTIAEKLQSLVENSGSPRGYHQRFVGTKVSRHSPSRPRRLASAGQIDRSAIQDDIVDCLDPHEDESGIQGSSRYLENPPPRSRPARNVQKRHPVYKDEPLEDIDNEEDFFEQETRTATSIFGAPSTAPTSISERFRDALLSAPPDVTSTERFGLSARLETVLSAQKNKYVSFTKSLQRKHQGGNLGQCLEVVVLGTTDEAQLTVCRCEVIRSPQGKGVRFCAPLKCLKFVELEEWNQDRSRQKVGTENAQDPLIIDIIFSKISSGVELHVGRVVRIHPPWQEVPRAGQSARLIFCSFFCEVLR